jgi:DeoD family purine-nucleoside phosphorylase
MPPLEDIELPTGDAGETLHLNPAADFHPNVLLPGDPARAMSIATRKLTAPRMFNHRRGLWGYSGETPDGVGMLIQATGMGGPSAAIVAEELCDLGAKLLIRVGTCGALDPQVKLGDLVVGRRAIAEDGTSRALGTREIAEADDVLSDLLLEHANLSGRSVHDGAIATVDLFYDPDGAARYASLVDRQALAIEMEAAAIFAVARRRGVRSACLLGVTDELHGNEDRVRMSHDDITELGEALGDVGVAAMSAAAA